LLDVYLRVKRVACRSGVVCLARVSDGSIIPPLALDTKRRVSFFQKSQRFFFEKKKQKTFISFGLVNT
jgi:hypothetical protein